MVLVIGATGFVGRTVCSRLIEDGFHVRAMTRHVGQADVVLGHLKDIEIVRGDALEAGSIIRAMEGQDTIVFLATSLTSAVLERPVDELDKRMSANLIRACSVPNPPRIIYLSWICDPERAKSSYIETQLAREKEIVNSGLPYAIFRAPVVIGRWGLFFRLTQTVITRLPVLWLPKNVSTPCQPIYVGDVANYISALITEPPKANKIYEIAGNDVLSYYDMIDLFIAALGTSKLMVPLPLSFTRSATALLSKQTGIPNQAVIAFLDNMSVPMVASDDSAGTDFPDIHPLGFMDAIQKALRER
jgi:uncharacterized protein YbjT (DUF2867 family)